MNNSITIDYTLTAADCVAEALKCYPLAQRREEAFLCYFYYCKMNMESAKADDVWYRAKLRYNLLRLVTIGEEQLN